MLVTITSLPDTFIRRNLHKFKMAAIPTYFRLYLITWDLQDYKFGVYTNVLRVNEYVGNKQLFHHLIL